MAIVAPVAPNKENGMGIDLGSRAERGRRDLKHSCELSLIPE